MVEASFLASFDNITLALIMAIFLFSGVVKGFLGIGLPAAAMAFLTLVMAPTEAIALLIMPIIFTNFFQFARAQDRAGIANRYKYFGAAIIVSIFVTSLFIADYPTALLTVAIGFAMVVFAVNLLFGLAIPMGPGVGWQVGIGLVSGVLGGLSSIWSPPVAMYLIVRKVSKEEFIGATGFLFLCGCFPLALGLFFSGVVTGATIIQSLIALVFALIGFRIGEALRHRISQDLFRRVVLVAFLVMGLRLMAVGLL